MQKSVSTGVITASDITVADIMKVVSTWARGYKTFFMLSSDEHEILNAPKYIKKIKKFSVLGSDNLIMLFSLFINVEMPTTVGILTLTSRKNFKLSLVEHENFL